MWIPDEILPPLHKDYDGNPKLPGVSGHIRPVKSMEPVDKAWFYYNQALGSLALAKYWIEKEDV